MSPPIRIRRLAPTELARRPDWVAALQDFRPESAEVLKRDRDVAVYRARLAGRDVVIKCWPLRSPLDRLKVLLHRSRGDRHWRGARWLAGHKIPTAAVYALATRGGVGETQLLLVMEALPGKTVLQHLADGDLPVACEHTIAADMGRFAELIHLAGGFNRDPKPSNHIVTSTDVRDPCVAVIDCADIRRSRPEGLERMLASMVIEAIGVGCPPRRSLMMRAIRICRARPPHQLWRRVSALIHLHGDPTPRVNPLTPPR